MKKFWQIWWLALAVKLAVGIFTPLSNDESYYWVWGHFPQLSYFDHPPMIGWIFSLGRLFDGWHSAVRIPSILLAHITLLIWLEIARPQREPALWLLLLSLSPFLGIGSLIATPDVPLLFFWSLALLILLKWTQTTSDRYKFGLSAALGFALGCGFCSKYQIVLFAPIALAWAVASRQFSLIRLKHILAVVSLGLLASSPVLYWNARNQWASFAFQIHHGLASGPKSPWHSISLTHFFEYAGAQIALLLPTTIWLATRRSTAPPEQPSHLLQRESLLKFFGWGPILFFAMTSLRAPVEANWPIMAYPALLSLAFNQAVTRARQRLNYFSISLWSVASFAVILQLTHPWLPIEAKKLKTYEFERFDALKPLTSQYSPLYFGSYQMAADISFKTKKQYFKLPGMNRTDFYDFFSGNRPSCDKFWVAKENGQALPDWVTSSQSSWHIERSLPIADEFTLVEVTCRAQHSDHQ